MVYLIYPQFEYDPEKSRANEVKHGIDFVRAQALWDDPNLLEIPARTVGEARFLLIGRLQEELWSAVVTYRGDRVRIISVRRARQEEKTLYEKLGL
jgi:uncharacterized DUF497 family protein